MVTEFETRKEIIDTKLAEAGWNVSDPTQVIEEFYIQSNESGQKEFCDYILLGKNGKPVAVVEAKKSSINAEIGREQAKQYCHGISKHCGVDLPLCLYTNGHDIFFWNINVAPPKKVHGFPTRQDIERLSYIRKNQRELKQEFIDQEIAGRDFQLQAIRSVMEGIEKNQTKFLLVMATGTGKTRTCIALVDALMRANRVQRVLFLVDRIALRGQALDAFKEHIPDEPRWPELGEKTIETDRRIYVSTYQTMLNIVRDPVRTLSPHFFDLIIIDESHRSIYNTYGEILEYFNSIELGLTATPRDVVDHNTFELFECSEGLPTFAYSYEEAINHVPPYLCDFNVLKIKTRFQEEGINKRTITLEDQKKLIFEGKEIAEINYEGTDLEKTVTNGPTNSLIVKEFMESCIKDPDGVLPGKTIFFCMSMKHARRIEAIFDALYPEYKGELAKVMVSDDPRVYGKGGLLDQFTRNNMPRIAISVDMLDTGIDVREIVNLVFAKPVFSYTKFWQMIGRGTRLIEYNKIKPWCPEKDVFQIMDCWDNFEYFKLTPKGREPKSQTPLPVKYFLTRLEKIEAALVLQCTEILIKESLALRLQIEELPRNSVSIMEKSVEVEKCNDANFWGAIDPEKILFLRHEIAPLFRVLSQVDFKAMRFQRDVLEASLAKLKDENEKLNVLVENVIEQISELPLTVNIVAEKAGLIQKAQSKIFWDEVSDNDFDILSSELSKLMIFRDTKSNKIASSSFSFSDSIVAREFVEFGPEHESLSVANYRKLVEEKVTELTDFNPVLKKVRDNEPISNDEIEDLAKYLEDEHPHITIDLLRRVYQHKSASLIRFIKHILGIEILENFPDTVSKSIDLFISKHPLLNSNQMQFLSILRDYIINRGGIEKRDLIQAPFTIIHPKGIRGIFSPLEIDEILKMTERLAA